LEGEVKRKELALEEREIAIKEKEFQLKVNVAIAIFKIQLWNITTKFMRTKPNA